MVAPPKMLADAINNNPELQRLKVLFISSRRSSRLDRNTSRICAGRSPS